MMCQILRCCGRLFRPAGTARVLITSTRQSQQTSGHGVAVDAFSADEASAFLGARTVWTMRRGRLRWLPCSGICRWRWLWPRR